MSEESKTYRLYVLVSKKIIASREVIFEENKCWNWGKTNEEVELDTHEWKDSNIEESEHDQSEEESEEEVIVEEEGEVNIYSNDPSKAHPK